MAKILNHKIFNLIIMIIAVLVIFGVPNVSYAYEVVYSADQDYIEEDDSDVDNIDQNQSIWTQINNNKFYQDVRANVAKWYYVFRYMAIIIMLGILVFLAIKMALASLAPQKAIYKKMLVDWVACFILLFMSHYYMIFIQYLNDWILRIIKEVGVDIYTNGKYDLYQTVKTRAYDVRFTIGFPGMLLYISLVYFTAKYIYIYAKRFILMIILTIIAPITILFYSVQKVLTGKSKVFTKWMEEYAVNVLIQAIHALIYVVFVGTALRLSEKSLFGVILSFVFLNFMSKADKMFRKIFKFSSGSSMAEEIANSQLSELKDNLSNAVMASTLLKQTDLGKKVSGVVSGVSTGAAIWLGGAIQHSDAYQKLVEDHNSDMDRRESKFNENILKETKNAQEAQEKLDNHQYLNEKERVKLQKAVKKAEKQILKNTTKRQNLAIRRGIYERMREAFDYDNYTEFVEAENGDYDIGIDADGEETIVKVQKGKGKYKRRIIRSKKIFNAQTRKYEKVGGISKKFQEKKDEILGLTKEQKEILTEAKTMIKDEVLGFGAMLLGMGFVADNPSVGLLLLASGGKKWRDLNKDKTPVKMNAKAKRAIKRVLKQQDKEYKHARFTTGSLLAIDEVIQKMNRTDVDVASINHMINGLRSGSLKYSIPTLPFTLTGSKGIIYNALETTKKAEKQLLADIKQYERTVDIELKKALVYDIVNADEEFLKEVAQYLLDKDIARMMFENRRKNQTIVQSKNGKTFAINTVLNKNNIGSIAKIRNIIINVAMKNRIYNLEELDLSDRRIQKEIIKALKDEGVITGTLDELQLEKVLMGEFLGKLDEEKQKEKENLMLAGTKFLEAELQENQAYIVDLEKTIKDNYYKTQNAYIQAKLGVSIEVFANAIAGKNLVGEFNGFKINTADFATAEEIVKAYYKFKRLDAITHESYKSQRDAYYRSILKTLDRTIVGMKKGSLVVLPKKGTSIEDFASQIAGKNLIATFNGFTIDTRYYGTAEDIVNAYKTKTESDTLVNDEMIVVDVDQTKGIDEIANEILGKKLLTEYDGFVIDTSKFSSADEIIEQYNIYKANDTATQDNADIIKRNVKYGEDYYSQVGVAGFISMLNMACPDVMKKKLYEEMLINYIKTHDINDIDDLSRAQEKIKQWYKKELEKDEAKQIVLKSAIKTKKSWKDITANDIFENAEAKELGLMRGQIFRAMNKDKQASLISPASITNMELEKLFIQKLNEWDSTIDKIVLTALSESVMDPSGVDIKNPTNATLTNLKANMLISAKASGIRGTDEEIIDLLQDRIDNVTQEDVENILISNMVSKYIVDKCDGDASKLQSDTSLADELNQMILDKLSTPSSEQEEKVEDVIDIMKTTENVNSETTVGNYMQGKYEKAEDSTDPDLDVNIPLPEVKVELVNGILSCFFSIPTGVDDVKIESCSKSLEKTDEKFIPELQIITLENKKYVACSRLVKSAKHGPTLVIKYPEELVIAGRTEESVEDEQTDRETELLATEVVDNISMLKRFSTPEDVFGKETVELLNDEEIQLLFRSGEIKKAQNITQSVIEKFRESGTSVIKEEEEEKLTKEIKEAITENDFTIGMRAFYDTDTDKFDEVRKKSTDLLQALLQYKAVDEDLDKLKVKKDPKNYKKSRKINQDLVDRFNEIDIDSIIQTINSGRGGRV